MNALEFLQQAYLLEQRIETKLHQITLLRSMGQTLRSFAGNEPVNHTRNISALEDSVLKIMEQEQELGEEIDHLVDLKKEIQDVISQVKDMNYRLILEKRHLCFESWPRIGEEMGHTDRWAQAKHAMALQVVQQILDRRMG